MMQRLKLSGRGAGAAVRPNGRQSLSIQNYDLRIAKVGDIQELLLSIRRKGKPCRCLAARADHHLRNELSIGVENLNALITAVGDIHRAIVRNLDAVDE